MAAKRKRAKKTAKKHTKKHVVKHAKKPAKKRAKRVMYGPVHNKRLAGKGPYTIRKNQVPTRLLEERLVHLNNILKKRGGKHFA